MDCFGATGPVMDFYVYGWILRVLEPYEGIYCMYRGNFGILMF